MKKTLISLMTVACLLWAGSAFATPTLQLDISNGVYDTDSETVVSTGPQFTLYALLNLDGDDGEGNPKPSWADPVGSSFYISMAVSPALEETAEGESPPDLGFFNLDEKPIMATADMVYGIPPEAEDLKNLGPHGIFKTYYYELEFNFDTDFKSISYNVEDNAGGFEVGTDFYYMGFNVDVGGLAEGYEIHFDLYGFDDKGKLIKAPYSHDAESGGTPVPEPSTLLLLGAGLAGLGGFARRFRK